MTLPVGFFVLALIGFGAMAYEIYNRHRKENYSMTAHMCEQYDSNCFRCNLNMDELEDTEMFHHDMDDLFRINDALTELVKSTLHFKFSSEEIEDQVLDDLTHHVANTLWPENAKNNTPRYYANLENLRETLYLKDPNVVLYCNYCKEEIAAGTEHRFHESDTYGNCKIVNG